MNNRRMTMRAYQIIDPGPNGHLSLCQRPIPTPNANQMVIRVGATALNRADLLQRLGKYPAPFGESDIPGLELAGEVVALGEHVRDFKQGDRVYALVAGGSYAEYCLVHHQLAAKIPDDWSFDYAAAIPEALTTAHACLVVYGQLLAQEKLLIHAAGSGITSFAVQMAMLKQATVISTASCDKKIAKAKALGLTQVINYKTTDFATEIALDSINLIVDYFGGDYLNKHLSLLASNGRLIQIASMAGRKSEIDVAPIIKKCLMMQGFVLRTQPLQKKIALWQSAQQQWYQQLLSGQLHPVIDSIFPAEEINQAQQYMTSGLHFGKIVIRL